MKYLLFIALFSLIFMSCDKIDEPEVLGTYSHVPEGCIPGDNPEFGCASSLTLSADGIADILPSGDIIYRTTFKIRGRKIIVAKADDIIDQFVFYWVDNSTLKNERDGGLWIRRINTN